MKLAFANEIVFIRKKQASKAKTPEFYESECLEYARKTNKKFLGFVMPWKVVTLDRCLLILMTSKPHH